MPHQAQKFGKEHWDAIGRECVDNRVSCAEFARRAQAGELENMAPFSISEQRVRDIRGLIIADRDRATFEGINDVAKRCRDRAWTMLDDMLEHMRANQLKRSDRHVKDMPAFEKAVGLIAKLEGQRTQPSKPGLEPHDEQDPAVKERKALEDRLSRAPSTQAPTAQQGNTEGHGAKRDAQPAADSNTETDAARQAV
jgi:hypothetical protein